MGGVVDTEHMVLVFLRPVHHERSWMHHRHVIALDRVFNNDLPICGVIEVPARYLSVARPEPLTDQGEGRLSEGVIQRQTILADGYEDQPRPNLRPKPSEALALLAARDGCERARVRNFADLAFVIVLPAMKLTAQALAPPPSLGREHRVAVSADVEKGPRLATRVANEDWASEEFGRKKIAISGEIMSRPYTMPSRQKKRIKLSLVRMALHIAPGREDERQSTLVDPHPCGECQMEGRLKNEM